ncbi:MAG: inositol monophosphatase family protein [Promethearchaeia archaeon]
MEVTIDFLKELAISVYDEVHDLIGTKKAAIQLEEGAGGDISMIIDRHAEDVIKNALEEIDVNVLLISEEIGEVFIGDQVEASKKQAKLIVDPIDGSNNAVRGIPFCCVSIAYAEGDSLEEILKAVIIDLNTKDIYWSEKGKGSFLNDEKITVSEKGVEDPIMFEIDFESNEIKQNLIDYSSIIEKIYRPRIMGSCALSLCLIAKGSLDGLIDFRESSRIMDIAAGYLIIREAGGNLYSRLGVDLDIKLTINAHIPLVASNKKLESFLKNELKKIAKKNREL